MDDDVKPRFSFRTEILDHLAKFQNLTAQFSKASMTINVVFTNNTVENVTETTDHDGSDISQLTKAMVETIGVISKNIKKINSSTAENINELVLNSTLSLLSESAREAWTNLSKFDQPKAATRLLAAVEGSSALLAKKIDGPRTIRKMSSGIVMQVDVMNVSQVSNQSGDSLFFNESSEEGESQFQIGLQDIKRHASPELGRVTFALYDNIGQWLHTNVSEDDNNATAQVVNTKIISATIVAKYESSTMKKMADLVQFTLYHKKPKPYGSNVTCVFWKYIRRNHQGHWSSDGCYVVSTDSKATTCRCNHLTNFAVLMTVTNQTMSEVDKLALSVITWIGCSLSIVCLALALLTFSCFRNLQCDRNTIHKNLVLCLLISEIIFVVGIERTENKDLCSVIAGFLHYFFLAAFSWMLMEGVQLYIFLIEIFKVEKPRAKWFYLAGYGVPIIIVSVSVAVFQQDYGADNKLYCWLKPAQIWAFVGPVLGIILANTVMLGVTIYKMCKHASKAPSWKMKGQSKLKTVGSGLRGAAILVVLLGTTWIFCVFYVNEHTVFMAYIFTILNTLQGFFIFIFHCAMNEKVRKEYRRAIQRCSCLPEKSKASYGSGNVTTSTLSKSPESMMTTFHTGSSSE